jgi:hypothetical protein
MGRGLGLSNPNSFLAMGGIATINNTGFVMHLPVAPKIEGMMTNATLSAIGMGLANQTAIVQLQKWETVYSYSSRLQLILSYSLAVFLAVIAVMFGFMSLWINRVSGDRGFFQILTTTRNPELDSFGADGWGKSNIEVLADTPLRFGVNWRGDRSYFATERMLRATG